MSENSVRLDANFEPPVFATSLIIYLGSDGSGTIDSHPKLLSVEMISTENRTISVFTPNSYNSQINCQKNPFILPIFHDFSRPVFYTKSVQISFSSFEIGLSAIGIRTSANLNPQKINDCALKGELYDPILEICFSRIENCDANRNCLDSVPKIPTTHGRWICEKKSQFDNSVCKLQCDNGFVLNSHENSIKCVHGYRKVSK